LRRVAAEPSLRLPLTTKSPHVGPTDDFLHRETQLI
jgi:hypothetical protein